MAMSQKVGFGFHDRKITKQAIKQKGSPFFKDERMGMKYKRQNSKVKSQKKLI